MAAAGVDVLLVRSADRFLNEYVPLDDSTRVWVSGFTGSMGEVIVAPARAYLAVDGRYWAQAERETDRALYEIARVPLGASIDETVAEVLCRIRDQKKDKKLLVGFEPDRITPATLELLQRTVADSIWQPLWPSPVEVARGPSHKADSRDGHIRILDQKKVGKTVEQKLAELGKELDRLGADALLVQKLDEIAYLSNLRGNELPYQATFKAIALATKDRLFIGLDPSKVPTSVRVARSEIMFLPENELWTLIGKKSKRKKVAFDRNGNTEHGRIAIEATGAAAIGCESPIGPMKAKKNAAEMIAMIGAFGRADRVVDQAARWLCREVTAQKRVTEADFADKVSKLFSASSATGLSFRIISAAGKNGAIIHYSDPSSRRVIKRGELMLLDTGAYYDEGYATDLTRTFLVDAPRARGTDLQRRYFTLVLKSAIAGMTAVLPEGSRGSQLDAITRAPLWAAGLNFNHGTGHGVGINVHEYPPRIGPNAQTVLLEGYVFSIEPGVYLPSFGGIRIENLCTLEKMPKHAGFMRVKPLTHSPLDRRLIETSLLTPAERAWLAGYAKAYDRRAPASSRR